MSYTLKNDFGNKKTFRVNVILPVALLKRLHAILDKKSASDILSTGSKRTEIIKQAILDKIIKEEELERNSKNPHAWQG